MCKKIILLLGFIFSYTLSFSQNGNPENDKRVEITYNLDTKKLSGEFPFDKYFKLNIESKTRKLGNIIRVYEMSYDNDERIPSSVKKEYKKYKKDLKRGVNNPFSKKIEPDQKLKIKKLESDKNKYYTIVEALLPNKQYDLTVDLALTNNELKLLYRVILLIDSDELKAKKLYESNFEILDDKLLINARSLSTIASFSSFKKYYEEKLKNQLIVYDLSNLDDFSGQQNSSDIKYVGEKLKNNKLDFQNYGKMMNVFLSNNLNWEKALFRGESSYTNNKEENKFHMLNRFENISKTKALIQKVNEQIKILNAIDDDAIVQRFLTNFSQKVETTIVKNEEKLKKYSSNITNRLSNTFGYSELISITTTSSDVKTRNAQYLVTDFGFTNALGYNNNGELQYIGRPNFGVNWHIGGIDKDQELRFMRKHDRRLWHRFSIAFGVTVGKIDEEDYTDLFNGLSPTLGINYRITRQVRIGTGVLFVREKSANPLLTSNDVEVAPYLNISFDFSLFSQLGSLAGRVFN